METCQQIMLHAFRAMIQNSNERHSSDIHWEAQQLRSLASSRQNYVLAKKSASVPHSSTRQGFQR